VTVDTTPVAGAAGYLAFDFVDGDGLTNNQITIVDFVTDGGLGLFSATGDVTGNLIPGPLRLGDSGFFNEGLQAITFGTAIEFRFTLTANGPYQPSLDAFSFFLLDDTFLPFPTDDPSFSDALIVADIADANPLPIAYTSAFASVTLHPASNGGPVSVPATAALLSLGIAGFGYRRCRQVASDGRV